jgi:hypothetical protein
MFKRLIVPKPLSARKDDPLPQGHRYDEKGRSVLIGLTWEETREFEELDESLPFEGQPVWPDEGLRVLPREERWHKLWMKHRAKLSGCVEDRW